MSEVGATSFIDFWQLQICARVRTTVFRRQNSTFRKRFFLKFGCVPVLRYLIRILRASFVQIGTEMTKKYSNQRYAVDTVYAVSTSIHKSPIHPLFVRNRVFCLPRLHSTPPLGGSPSEYRHPVWYGKTRMVWLPDGEKNSKICLFVLTWSMNVTDGRTLHADIGRAYASHSAAKINSYRLFTIIGY